MRRFLFLLFASVACLGCYAQDVSTLSGIGYAKVVNLLGTPEKYEVLEYDGYWDVLDYKTKHLLFSTENGELDGFICWDPSLCMLSDQIPGGVRVGDSISNIPSSVGALHRLQDPFFYHPCPLIMNYVMFEHRCTNYLLSVENDVIKAIAMTICEDNTGAGTDRDFGGWWVGEGLPEKFGTYYAYVTGKHIRRYLCINNEDGSVTVSLIISDLNWLSQLSSVGSGRMSYSYSVPNDPRTFTETFCRASEPFPYEIREELYEKKVAPETGVVSYTLVVPAR
ncbi:MAG: hypothetical protein MJY83_00670 [Bacteroidales bacterium]|nr:hypothetical protein [Bacteroidales bacterium]